MYTDKTSTRAITQIAISVAALIAGGFVIFILTSIFSFPGIKFIMMAPYLSFMLTIMVYKIEAPWLILKINTVFALIMSFINLYMGIAIILTGLVTQLTYFLPYPSSNIRNLSTTSLYSGFTVVIALHVSKVLIGGAVYELITFKWLAILFILSTALGLLGSLLGFNVIKRIHTS